MYHSETKVSLFEKAFFWELETSILKKESSKSVILRGKNPSFHSSPKVTREENEKITLRGFLSLEDGSEVFQNSLHSRKKY